MNNIRGINSKEIIIQLERAKVQKDLLIKNICKEYEIYFHIVRNSILASTEKGILSLFSDLSISDKALNSSELSNFIKEHISLLIHTKLPFITIEQLKLGDISDPHKHLVNLNALKELVKSIENQTDKFDYENDLNINEFPEFKSNNNSNNYYYGSLNVDEDASINFDEREYLNTFSSQNSIKDIEYKKHADAFIELIEQTTDNKLYQHENINNIAKDFSILNHNLDLFEFIDKSFSNLLLNLSYVINSELFKKNLIKNIVSENTFKCLSNNYYFIKHPHPFIIRYDLNANNLTIENKKFSDIYLFNITNIELEFYNLDLSICRNNINELKNKFRLLNKKQNYWKLKEFSLKKLI